ncbi:hypothetical protein BCV37_00655 [Vibrio cyclitrophicus]
MITKEEVVHLVTFSFYVYLSFSVAAFFIFSDSYRHFSFDGIILDRAFHGIEGSPANIDTFATVFILIYLFERGLKQAFSYIHLVVFILVVYFCSTETPYLILLSYFSYRVLYSFFGLNSNRFVIFSLIFTMTGVFYLSLNNDAVYDFLLFATNGRNYIWNTQINNIIDDFSLVDLFFGSFSNAFVSIHWSAEDTNNPHNGFLFIIIRFGVLLSFSALLYMYYISRFLNDLQYLIILSLLAASVSNSNIFYIVNPMISLLLVYSLIKLSAPPCKVTNYNKGTI